MIPPREGDITRVEAFSDGMIAFAATLLVVSLETPKTYDGLVANLYGFFPFGLSFAALFLIWLVHTSLFRRYPLNDRPSILLNGALLFTVLFYVYPLKFLAASFAASLNPARATVIIRDVGDLRGMFIMYAVGWMVIFTLFSLLYRRAYSTRDQLSLTPTEAYDAITWSRHYIGFVIAGALSLIVAYFGIGVRWGLPGIVYGSIGFFSSFNARQRAIERAHLARKIAEHPQLADTAAIRTSELIIKDIR